MSFTPSYQTSMHRVNMLSVFRTGAIIGSYIIDPALAPSSAHIDADDPNLRLVSSESTIEADVWVVRDGTTAASKTLMDFLGRGHVYVRIHSSSLAPGVVNAESEDGDVVIIIPRDFVGLVRTSGAPEHTPTLPGASSTLSLVGGEGVHFIGDWTRIGLDGWTGPTLHLRAPNGKITVRLWQPTKTTPVPTGGASLALLVLLLVVPRPPAWLRWCLSALLMCGLLAYSFWLETMLM